MSELINYYQSQIDTYTIDLKRIRLKRNIITSLKLISFSLIIYMIYLLISANLFLSLWGIGAMIISLIALTVVDSRIVNRINLLTELINVLKKEIDYLNGDLSSFDTGKEYLSTTHPYSYDLDIFGEESIFQSLNRTVTSGGSQLLADYLSIPSTDPSEITERQQAVEELKKHNQWGHLFRATGATYKTTSSDNSIVDSWGKTSQFLSSKWLVYLIYISNAITLLSWVLVIFDLIPHSLPRALSLIQLIVSVLLTKRLNKQHSKLNVFIKAVGNYFYLVKLADGVDFQSTRLKGIKSRLLGNGGAMPAFTSLNNILGQLDQRSNVFATIILDSLFMKSIHHAISLDRWKRRHSQHISGWISAISELDAFISMSNYSYNHPEFSVPLFDSSTVIRCVDMCHPLLRGSKKVSNNFEIHSLHDIFVVTGANMAGKSTFLRSVGVNFVLASSGNVVCSSHFAFTPMAIFTSMRTTDNLSKGTSYFHAELLRLKDLIIMASQGVPVFMILDEMLKGTNSADKLNGSIKFLKRLHSLPICGLVATHDLMLGNLSDEFPNNFHNVCFEITHQGNDIVYDYKLKEGVSKNMNASILLQQMGLI